MSQGSSFWLPRSSLAIAGVLVSALLLVVCLGSTEGNARAMPGPSTFSTGFVDDEHFLSMSLATEQLWLGRAARIGSAPASKSKNWVRLTCTWSIAAPTKPKHPTDPNDPAYHWAGCDAEISTAVRAGLHVLVMTAHAPRWAEGRNRPAAVYAGAWRPSARAFGQFAQALAKRYSGKYSNLFYPGTKLPKVTYFQAWNEPNLWTSLAPQWRRAGHSRLIPESPTIYRNLLNAFYENVKKVDPAAHILAAGTSPYGDHPAQLRGKMAPLEFDREVLCLHGSGLSRERCHHPAHLDALDDHPYSLLPTTHAVYPDDLSVPDLGKLRRLLRAARRDHTVLPAQPKQVWETELNWPSDPPSPTAISTAVQARYLDRAWYVEWSEGVSHALWFLITDGALGDTGVFFADGTPKPSATAFHFPFVAIPDTHGRLIIWGRTPVPGTVTIEAGGGRGWRSVLHLKTTHGGIFYVDRPMRHRPIFRATQGSSTSLGWTLRPPGRSAT
jgi:hypothetical protein